MDSDLELDVSGLLCPLPILKAKKALNPLQSGQVLHVIATDRAAVADFAAFAKQTGHALVECYQQNSQYHFFIQKK